MAVVTIVRLISVPIFLSVWSTELYGEWLVLYSLLAYFSMGNLGIAQAAANDMTMSVARSDKTQALITYQTSFTIIFAISVVLLLSAWVTCNIAPLAGLLNFHSITGGSLKEVLMLFVGYVVMGFIVAILVSAYRCVARFHRGLMFYNAWLVFEFLVLSILLIIGTNPVIAAISMVSGRFLAALAMIIDLRFVAPWLTIGFTSFRYEELKRIISPSLSFAAFPIGQTLLNQGVTVFIGVLEGPAQVVLFNSIRTLTNLVTRLFEVVNQAFYPEISIAWSIGDISLLKRLHRSSFQASLWLCLAAITGLAFLGPFVFNLWTRGKVPLDSTLFYGFLALVLLRCFWYTSFAIPSAINRLKRLTACYLGASAVSLGISIVALKLDISFVLIGFAIVEIAMILVVLPESLTLSKDSLYNFLGAVTIPPNIGRYFRRAK
jgi:O-antigen/teichoic acid export membrane protein